MWFLLGKIATGVADTIVNFSEFGAAVSSIFLVWFSLSCRYTIYIQRIGKIPAPPDPRVHKRVQVHLDDLVSILNSFICAFMCNY